jgi:two-component system, OmpR family, sensor histidine kinase VicK
MQTLDFERRVETIQGWLKAVQHYATGSPEDAKVLLPQVMSELAVALEELSVATEELQVQNQELTAAYEALELKRRHYQELFEFAPDAYLVTDMAGVIRDANRAATRLFKREHRFLVGKPLAIYIPHEDRQNFYERLNDKSSLSLSPEWEARIEPREGEQLPVAIATSPIYNNQHLITGFRWLLHDLTERKRAELVRQELKAEKEVSELKSRFIRTMSHEFRTPLNVIQMASSLLERYGRVWSVEEQERCLQRIPSAVRSLTQMLEKILTYGKTEANQLEFNPQWLNLEQVCINTVNLYRSQIASDRQIFFDCQGDCATVYFDSMLIQQILDNLLSNALKYSPSDRPVYLRLNCQTDQVVIQVQDEGIGIPPEDRSRLMQPFHRGGNVENKPGTGLGLAIVQQAVMLHRGTIQVDSQLDVGSTFTITLPIHWVDNNLDGNGHDSNH